MVSQLIYILSLPQTLTLLLVLFIVILLLAASTLPHNLFLNYAHEATGRTIPRHITRNRPSPALLSRLTTHAQLPTLLLHHHLPGITPSLPVHLLLLIQRRPILLVLLLSIAHRILR